MTTQNKEQKKQSKSTQTKKVSEIPKTTAKVETPAIPKEKSLPKRYYVQFWKRMQPSDPRFDEVVGTIYWSDVEEDIVIEGLHNRYSTKIGNLLTCDLALPNGLFVSRVETPKDWVRKLHKAILVDGFYAKDYMEVVDETE